AYPLVEERAKRASRNPAAPPAEPAGFETAASGLLNPRNRPPQAASSTHETDRRKRPPQPTKPTAASGLLTPRTRPPQAASSTHETDRRKRRRSSRALRAVDLGRVEAEQLAHLVGRARLGDAPHDARVVERVGEACHRRH